MDPIEQLIDGAENQASGDGGENGIDYQRSQALSLIAIAKLLKEINDGL